jgi:alpha-1,3-mannosyltransferase
MKIRVTHVVRQFHPAVGGMEEVVRNIVRHQREVRGHEPKVITLDRVFREPERKLPAQDVIDGSPVVRLPYSGSERYPICPRVLRHLSDADVVHVHAIDFFFDYVAFTRPLHRKPLIASTHGGFFHTAFAQRLKQIYFQTVTRTSALAYDRICATSENDGQLFSQIVSPKKLHVVENGVDVRKYRDKGSKTPVRTLIYFGRWSSNKGLLDILEFMRELVSRDPGWRLIIAGREYDFDEARLRSAITQAGVDSLVSVVPNPSDEALADLIAQASYFICLSTHEGFGIAPVEAMSAGLTPILSDIPPFRRLQEKTGQGIIFRDGDHSKNCEQLLASYSGAESSYQQRRTELQQGAHIYDWAHVADVYADHYESIAR